MLHTKRLEAIEKGIEFKVFADFTEFRQIRNEDLCVIISNTIDNALRECRLMKEENPMCKKCQYIRHCKTRGCQVANYEIHQNVYQPIKVNCEVTKWMYHLIQTNLTEKQLEKLKQEYERRYLRHGK